MRWLHPAFIVIAACVFVHVGSPAWSQDASVCRGHEVTLRLLSPVGSFPLHQQLVDWQKDNPCTHIEAWPVPYSRLSDEITILASSPNPPDLIVYNSPNTQEYAHAGLLLSLEPYLPAGFKADLEPAFVTENSYQGQLFSPGIEEVTLALFYNKALVNRFGIVPPGNISNAWTWEQALKAFQTCQQTENGHVTVWGLGPTRFGNGEPGEIYRDLLFQRSAGNRNAVAESSALRTFSALSADGRKVSGYLDTREALKALDFYWGLYNREKVTPKVGIPNAFINGKACFTIDNSGLLQKLIHGKNTIDWGVSPLPYFRTPIVHTGSITIGVIRKTRYPSEAARFAIGISSGRYALDYLKQTGRLPIHHSMVRDFPELQTGMMRVFEDERVHWGVARPVSTHFIEYDEIVSDALRDIAFGAVPMDRMKQAIEMLTFILEQ